MAVSRSSARRYAEAAFEIAERDGTMDAWLAAFDVAEERLARPDAAKLLANPAVPAEARVSALERILGDDVEGPQRNLLSLLVRRGRISQVGAVAGQFRRLYRRREGIVEATVTSARELDDAERSALEERLIAMTGSRIEMRLAVDESLLGGLQVRLGDRLIDGSVRGRLERLRASLANTAI